jgi:hypothetical protein
MFVVTPPTSVADAPVSSMFDSRPSESYGDGRGDDDRGGESDVAFEAEDAVMFETALDEPAAGPVAEPVVAAEPVVEAATDDVLVEVNVVLEPVVDEPIELPAAAPKADDRVLAQFAATVPQDLAELQRIAADNQW